VAKVTLDTGYGREGAISVERVENRKCAGTLEPEHGTHVPFAETRKEVKLAGEQFWGRAARAP
jgi:hypothetical protein